MAVFKICAVRDAAIDAFGQPIFVRHLGEAIRSFTDEVNRSGSVFNAHPSDYELYHIGDYDDDTATLRSVAALSLVTGKAANRENKE